VRLDLSEQHKQALHAAPLPAWPVAYAEPVKIANSCVGDSDIRIQLADRSPATPKRLELAVCAAIQKRWASLKKQTGRRTSRRLNTCELIGDDEIGDEASGGRGTSRLADKIGQTFPLRLPAPISSSRILCRRRFAVELAGEVKCLGDTETRAIDWLVPCNRRQSVASQARITLLPVTQADVETSA